MFGVLSQGRQMGSLGGLVKKITGSLLLVMTPIYWRFHFYLDMNIH